MICSVLLANCVLDEVQEVHTKSAEVLCPNLCRPIATRRQYSGASADHDTEPWRFVAKLERDMAKTLPNGL